MKFGEEISIVYQAWNTWCTSIGLQKEMDKCFIWLKLQWVGSYLNGVFMFIHSGMSPLVSKV
jgi:hypothetical protein